MRGTASHAVKSRRDRDVTYIMYMPFSGCVWARGSNGVEINRFLERFSAQFLSLTITYLWPQNAVCSRRYACSGAARCVRNTSNRVHNTCFSMLNLHTGNVVHQPSLVQRITKLFKDLVDIIVLFFKTIFDPSAADGLKKRGAEMCRSCVVL